MNLKLLPASLILCLTSCATNGPLYGDVPPVVPGNMAQVVFYRDVLPFVGAAWPHHYYIDNTLVAELKIGGFTRVTISPGSHAIQTGPASHPDYRSLRIDVIAGRTYYFREKGGLPAEFNVIPAERAQRELERGYHYQAPVMSSFK